MRICIATPAPAGSARGNRVTADRWARFLRQQDHQVEITTSEPSGGHDLLIALHAVRSSDAIARFQKDRPGCPVVLALTGTDVYGDLSDERAVAALDAADRIIVLQPLATDELPEEHRDKVRVIYQSVEAPEGSFRPRRNTWEVLTVANVRPVKDPFLPARAAQELPEESRIQIVHLGEVLDESLRAEFDALQDAPRYSWREPLPHWKALRLMARCRLLVVPSKLEGGPNCISEAIAVGLPILATEIPGNVGLLGEEYSGYFPVGDASRLAELMRTAETEREFRQELTDGVYARQKFVNPERERQAWLSLIKEVEELA